MMSISPAFGQSLPVPRDQYAGQTPHPCGIAKMSATKRPRVYAFLELMRIELRLPPTGMPSESSTASTTVLSDWTYASFFAASPSTKLTRPCVGSASVKKSQLLRGATRVSAIRTSREDWREMTAIDRERTGGV